MKASDATGAQAKSLDWSKATIERLAHEKCALSASSTVPEVREQQCVEIDAEAEFHILKFCVDHAGGEV